MTVSSDKSYRKIALNRKALRDYFVLERHEAGIELRGTEVKSVKNGHVSLAGGYARVENGVVVLYNMNIPLYEQGNRFNHEPDRPRCLLLHKQEIRKFQVHVEQKGLTLVPLSVYVKKGMIKVEIGLCKGRTQGDKRELMKRKTADREAERAVRGARRHIAS